MWGTEEVEIQTIAESDLDSDSDEETDSCGDLQDGGDEEWTSFLSDSDVASLLAVSCHLSAVASVHAMHLEREDQSTRRT